MTKDKPRWLRRTTSGQMVVKMVAGACSVGVGFGSLLLTGLAMQVDHVDIFVQDFSLAFSADGTSPLCEQLELLEAGVDALEDAYTLRSTMGMRSPIRSSYESGGEGAAEELCEVCPSVNPVKRARHGCWRRTEIRVTGSFTYASELAIVCRSEMGDRNCAQAARWWVDVAGQRNSPG